MKSSIARVFASLIGGIATILPGIAPAMAQEPPDWKPREICAQDSAAGQCLLFEQRARNAVTASWTILPEAVRKSCLARFTAPLEPSWRILGDCIGIEGYLARQEQVAAQRKREDSALEELNVKRLAAQIARQAEQNRVRRLAAERKRVEDEKASFLALLAEQRQADAEAARRKSAAKATAEAQRLATAKRREEAERQAKKNPDNEAKDRRVAAEEASFMALLAEQRRADAQTRKRTAAAPKPTANKAAEAERKRIAAEEASFMKRLAAQRQADAEAARRKAAAKKAAAAKAAETERERVETERLSFMASLAAQRKTDKAAKQAAAQARKVAAQSCQARLRKIKSSSVVRFAYNKSQLSEAQGAALLDRLAQGISKCEGKLSIVIEGHTDSKGTARGNASLSKARAEAVAKYLIRKGIAADRVSWRGLGSKEPIAPNNTPQGRAKNRRIEFTVN